MKDKLNRREFMELSGKGMLGAGAGLTGVDKLVEQFTPNVVSAQNQGGNNTKSAASAITLPKGGGAVRGIGEKFQANPHTGTGNFSVPIFTSPGRGGFGPELSLQYSTGNSNGAFGMGWGLSVPMVSRKTDKGIPTYDDREDVFILSGSEDLVPYIKDGEYKQDEAKLNGEDFYIYYYRPRVEGLFAKIEYWRNAEISDPATKSFWKITTKENVTSIYGYNPTSKLKHSQYQNDDRRVFNWMLELTYDAKGNYIFYQCKEDNAADLIASDYIYEAHRITGEQVYQLYLETIQYGNFETENTADFDGLMKKLSDDFKDNKHFFTVLFDYNTYVDIDGNPENIKVNQSTYTEVKETWGLRNDRFSYYRAGFEIRNYRRCSRVLMFHSIPGEEPWTLVRSTDFNYEENEHSGMSMLTKATQRGYRKNESIHFSEEKYLKDEGIDAGVHVESDYYAIKSFPPIEFTYSSFEPDKQKFAGVSAEGNDMPPNSLNDPNYTLVDLFGTGMPDILNTSPFGYFYWKNLGNGNFSRRRELDEMPAGVRLDMPGVGFGDMAGNGQPDLLVHQGSTWGFFEADGVGGWKNFRPYREYPSFQLNDPSIRLVDMTGDGKSDVLRTDENSFVWFPSEGEKGFGAPKHIRRQRDLEKFPDVDFSDPRIRLADMTGDNMTDIVMVHNGRIDYWANMGNGNFSQRITLENTPRFGANFNPSRLFLTDIDGSGTNDLLYVESGKIRFAFNQSGNKWSNIHEINGTPPVTDLDSIQVADVLGCGCAQILWTTNYRGAGRNHYMYLDFTGGNKPNLLIEMNNNMGSTTKAQYQPSTYFYNLDYQENPRKPWVSPLPIPVLVLEKVEKIDHISKTKLVTNYRYHHGFYDGKEREFRGFAFVEQWDTEEFYNFKNQNLHDNPEDLRNTNESYHVPPVYTKTWFHTGMYENVDLTDALAGLIQGADDSVGLDIHRLFKEDYFARGAHDFDLENSVFDFETNEPIDLASMSEAYRALRGQVLRQEVYAKDGGDKENNPYTISESNAKVKLIQPKGENKHAVYFVHPHESLSYHFERKMDDPRIGQELTLKVDKYGNVEESVSIVYPRKKHYQDFVNSLTSNAQEAPNPDWITDQFKMYGTYNRTKFAKEDANNEYYYLGIPYESKSFEIHGLQEKFGFVWDGAFRNKKLKHSHFIDPDFGSLEDRLTPVLHFHEKPVGFSLRLLSWSRTYFKADEDANNFEGCLGLGTLSRQLLPCKQVQTVFHQDQVNTVYNGEVTTELLEKGRYVNEPDGRGYWWADSGRQKFDAANFYLPTESRDPFGNVGLVTYDSIHLLTEAVTDPKLNTIQSFNDYVTLQPYAVRDANHNGSKVRFDALGLVAGSGVMGKVDANGKITDEDQLGDHLLKFTPIWEYGTPFWSLIDEPYDGVNDGADKALDYLKDATGTMLYDLWRNVRLGDEVPPVVLSIARETHSVSKEKKDNGVWEITKGTVPVIQRQLMYFDGLGREVQTKIEAPNDPTTDALRWISSGWKVYNNKGKVVRQFEPFYTNTSAFEDQKIVGISPTIFYDPLERVIATVHPDGSFEKVVFDAWFQTSYDRNDTINWVPTSEPYISGWFLANSGFKTWKERKQTETFRIEGRDDLSEDPSTPSVIDAVHKTEAYADTYSKVYLDSLGRPVLTIAMNNAGTNVERHFKTRVKLDIQGNDLAITDPREIECFRHAFDMAQRQLLIDSNDAGEKWALVGVDNNPVWSKDARGTIIIPEYDELRRPTHSQVIPMGDTSNAFRAIETKYGEDNTAQARSENKIGQVVEIKDQSGITQNLTFDFKGNVKLSQQQFWEQYEGNIDVAVNNTIQSSFLDVGGTFTVSSEFDGLNRVIESTSPDGSVHKPEYNKTNQVKGLKVSVKGAAEKTFVHNITYNARGQRERIDFDENTFHSQYYYEEDTFRMKRMITWRNSPTDKPDCYSANEQRDKLQDCIYTYDPVGNITQIWDRAYERVFNNNQIVDPICRYKYDALYRLIESTGRHHRSRNLENHKRNNSKHAIPFTGSLCPVDRQTNGKDLINYTQYFEYDKGGNITKIQLVSTGGRYTRNQTYATDSNQILTTGLSNQPALEIKHDANGNIKNFKTNQTVSKWDFANQIREVVLDNRNNNPDKAYYVYNSGGMRTRKIIKRQNGQHTERLYLAGYDLFFDYVENKKKETLKIDGCLVETDDNTVKPIYRYQLNNHLGSVCLVVDEKGRRISYEEYYAYGGTAIMVGINQGEVDRKRYRYSGKERDDETGLYYYGARYYLAWMGRWMKADPIGKDDGFNVFEFVAGNPLIFNDEMGLSKGPTTFDFKVLEKEINSLKNVMSGSNHGVLRGTFEAAIAEAQNLKIEIKDKAGNLKTAKHLNSLNNAKTAIQIKLKNIHKQLGLLKKIDVKKHGNILKTLNPLIKESKNRLNVMDKTIHAVNQIRHFSSVLPTQDYGNRLKDFPLEKGREFKHLVSQQLRNSKINLIPNYLSSIRASVMHSLKQVPATIGAAQKQVKDLTPKLPAAMASLRAAQQTGVFSKFLSSFGTPSKGLPSFGLVFMPSWEVVE